MSSAAVVLFLSEHKAALVTVVAVAAVVATHYILQWVRVMQNSGDLFKLKGPRVNLPIIGGLITVLLKSNFELLDRTKYEKWFPIFFDTWGKGTGYYQLLVGSFPMLHIINPDIIKLVIANPKHNRKPAGIYSLVFGRAFGDGLVTSHGEKWKMDRAAITPSFHFEALKGYADVMNEQSSIMVQHILDTPNGSVCEDVGNLTNMCAFDVILETALGVSMNVQTTGDRFFTDGFQRGAEYGTARFTFPWLQIDSIFYNLTPSGREMQFLINELNKLTKSIIDKRRQAIAEDPDIVSSGKRKSFLDIILTSPRPDGSFFSNKDLFDQINTFMGAGHDTTGSSTIWCLQLLGHHQDIQQKLFEEIEEVVGTEDYVSLDHLANMKYLDMVVKEGLRIYPGVPMFGRELEHDIEVDGHRITKGTIAVVHTLAMQRSKEVWGPDADKFDPERWTPEREAGRHPYSFLPFSAGSRNCVGQKFALQEEKIMLAKILQKVRVESVKDYVPSQFQIVLNPVGGVPMRIFHRS